MLISNKPTCCFIGCRKLPKEKLESIIKRLDGEVENLIHQGMTTFISGGAPGFDQIAAALVVAKKELGRDVRLIFALPCKNQDELQSDGQKRLYRDLLAEADEVIYVSEEYHAGCMKKTKAIYDQSFRLLYLCLSAPPRRQKSNGKIRAAKGVKHH